MVKVQKFSDEALTSAVEEYASSHKGNITATDVAKWANENVPGLEGVRDYHFMRKYKAPGKNGKPEYFQKNCTKRLQEINESRKISVVVQENPLLHSVSLDDFFNLDRAEQRKIILETREQFEKLQENDIRFSTEMARLRKEDQDLRDENARMRSMLESLSKEHKIISDNLKQILSAVDEDKRKQYLSMIGIEDNKFDFEKYGDSLTLMGNSEFSISNTIRRASRKTFTSISEGIDWDDE